MLSNNPEPAASSALPPRHALGLPAGSIRALLALGVLGLLWSMALLNQGKALPQEVAQEFVYLQILMVLILSQFFVSHGNSIGGIADKRSPLGLPRGSVRIILLAGYAGLAYFLSQHTAAFDVKVGVPVFLMLAVLLSGFFLGHIISGTVKSMSGGQKPYWYQDVEAWFALLAFIGLVVLAFAHLLNQNLSADLQIGTFSLQMILAGIVGFYFGARA